MPILETFIFQTSESTHATLSRALGRLDTKAWKGFLGAWIGRTLNDKPITMESHLVLAWDSLDAHTNAQSNASYLAFVTKHLKSAVPASISKGTRRTVRLASIGDDPFIAFDAPLTEVLLHTLKDGKTKEELDAIVVEVIAFLVAHKVSVFLPPVGGEVLESPADTELYSAIGWDGTEAHEQAVELEGLTEYVAKFLEVADVTQAWVRFERWA